MKDWALKIPKIPTLESVIQILPIWAEVMVFMDDDHEVPFLVDNVADLAERYRDGAVGEYVVSYLSPVDTSYEETKSLLFEIWVEKEGR